MSTRIDNENAISGYWGNPAQGRCHNCARRDIPVLVLQFDTEEIRFCIDCTEALNNLLTDALEDKP